MDNFIEFLYSRFLLSDGVTSGLEYVEAGNLFFDISGTDAEKALESGAAYVVTNNSGSSSSQLIVHSNPSAALVSLAQFHRRKIRRPILAITGSRGKTTLSALLQSVLNGHLVTYRTARGHHDLLGVAETILHVHPQVELTILEVGGEKLGQIARVCELARPTHGLITNIGKVHSDTFGGIEGVIRGKSELFDYLRKTNGQVFINQVDHILKNMGKRFANSITYPEPELKMISSNPYVEVSFQGQQFKTRFRERFQFENIAAVFAVAAHFGVPSKAIFQALSANS